MTAALMTRRETWTEYVHRITHGMSRQDVASAAGVDVSGLGRWLNDPDRRPRAEKVVAFARGLNESPVEALIAAGYLNESDVEGTVEITQPLSVLSDETLVEELRARLARRGITEESARRTPMGELRDKSKRRNGRA